MAELGIDLNANQQTAEKLRKKNRKTAGFAVHSTLSRTQLEQQHQTLHKIEKRLDQDLAQRSELTRRLINLEFTPKTVQISMLLSDATMQST